MTNSAELKAFLETLRADLGFSHCGWARLEKPVSIEFYRQWLRDGLHGEMRYLEQHLSAKENPRAVFTFARTALIFAIPYLPHPHPQPQAENFPLSASRVAAYARGGDYHHWLKARLRQGIEKLREHFPAAEFEAHTDSSPLLERDIAVRAGLGWIGRNSCVIHPRHGSFFLLGEILTSLDVENESSPSPDFCGTCNRCVDACPTNAILPDRRLDARRCISYLSIESRLLPAPELREKWGDWLFGCDICQTVCPWNNKPFGVYMSALAGGGGAGGVGGAGAGGGGGGVGSTTADGGAIVAELRWILSSSGKQLERAFRGTALARAGSFGLKRNALVVAGNLVLRELRSEILSLKDHPRLGELALWALERWDAAAGPE